MTKQVTINWNGGSRRIDLREPDVKKRMHHMATAPAPLSMNPKTLAWMNTAITLGSELDSDTVESMRLTNGIELFSEVLDHWKELDDGDVTSDESIGEKMEAMKLDDQGAVDLEEMR